MVSMLLFDFFLQVRDETYTAFENIYPVLTEFRKVQQWYVYHNLHLCLTCLLVLVLYISSTIGKHFISTTVNQNHQLELILFHCEQMKFCDAFHLFPILGYSHLAASVIVLIADLMVLCV